jgi:hypothetical protein
MELSIPWWAILIGAGIYMAVGFVWYLQSVFGREWIALMGWTLETEEGKRDYEARQKGMGIIFAQTAVMALIMSYTLANGIGMIENLGGNPYLLPLWLWVGFIAPTTYINALFAYKPKKLWLIDTAYPIVALFLMTAFFVI